MCTINNYINDQAINKCAHYQDKIHIYIDDELCTHSITK